MQRETHISDLNSRLIRFPDPQIFLILIFKSSNVNFWSQQLGTRRQRGNPLDSWPFKTPQGFNGILWMPFKLLEFCPYRYCISTLALPHFAQKEEGKSHSIKTPAILPSISRACRIPFCVFKRKINLKINVLIHSELYCDQHLNWVLRSPSRSTSSFFI